MFAPDLMAGFDEMLRGYLNGSLEESRWVVAKHAAGRVAGGADCAPEPFADRAWNLYFLAHKARLIVASRLPPPASGHDARWVGPAAAYPEGRDTGLSRCSRRVLSPPV